VERWALATSHGWKKPVPVKIHDCSNTGAKISIKRKDLPKEFPVELGTSIIACIEMADGPTYQLPFEVVWIKSGETEDFYAGCRSTNEPILASFVAQEVSRKSPLLTSANQGKLERDVHETALVLWIVCIALSFALPALSSGLM